MAKGDVLLITFPFTNLSGSKLRPAVILAETSLDVTVCFITSQTQWQEPLDVLISPSIRSGIVKQSLIRTAKIATLDRSLAKGLLGKLPQSEVAILNQNLKVLFQLK